MTLWDGGVFVLEQLIQKSYSQVVQTLRCSFITYFVLCQYQLLEDVNNIKSSIACLAKFLVGVVRAALRRRAHAQAPPPAAPPPADCKAGAH